MKIQVSDYIDVQRKARALGCNVPTRIAVLPENFVSAKSKKNLHYGMFGPGFRRLLQDNGIPETPLEREDDEFASAMGGELETLILPTIFVGGAFLSQNPHLISVALNVIAEYLVGFFKNVYEREPGELDRVKMEIVKSRGKSCRKVSYEGPVSGLEKLGDIVRDM